MVRLRDDYEDPHNPDELSDAQREGMVLWQSASDVTICRGADLGDPVADEIFRSWPAERRRAAAVEADAEDRAQY